MQYFMVKMAHTTDGSDVASSLAGYKTKAEALSAFHSELAYALVSDKVVKDSVTVIDSDSEIIAMDSVEGLGAKSAATAGPAADAADATSGE